MKLRYVVMEAQPWSSITVSGVFLTRELMSDGFGDAFLPVFDNAEQALAEFPGANLVPLVSRPAPDEKEEED